MFQGCPPYQSKKDNKIPAGRKTIIFCRGCTGHVPMADFIFHDFFLSHFIGWPTVWFHVPMHKQSFNYQGLMLIISFISLLPFLYSFLWCLPLISHSRSSQRPNLPGLWRIGKSRAFDLPVSVRANLCKLISQPLACSTSFNKDQFSMAQISFTNTTHSSLMAFIGCILWRHSTLFHVLKMSSICQRKV